ncbi:dTDP-4-dehydrorhamnose 3,5-epimerase [Saccharolobus solfataricus]|uniref:dTDP-4-dehydrorhamnose 3,5-epimerase n=2 Tax=Saccharolobus solfataricus TaxID=2287 RepID=A0A0E3K961_SACSO|nr:dTDP-4-dehydrorhamnose 3,5-epimerase [Saccharolobus solfataricus]AKA74655.1 dTDP-4-dehydrorhamnose 3,5-epimerase [Saccharolobus solfataricus]AKA77349.1 dTDP-4-dehydrorhamnose 3,5-epimerase [Saccharolobus solfataricus]AKA80040.1 dTDP-4-dehydrorhamnose 3,5-epimerase [Saccharolobus solfataricus]AZF69119.1 dTDP-4-dehydrorhamnose 3,5-epimerase [Saccharolobus solfataricus]AZF71739.1 dTDP-4-dehydrorhamnose 3,5-epimerase [Saccharolobus solfataricus]
MPFEFKELGMGIVLIKPTVFPDKRGFFLELYKSTDFVNIPIPIQTNMSFSIKGVIRGLHYQISPKEQGKIVFVPKGRILDVAVDIRKSSKTFGKYVSVELNEENHYLLWIPPGFAHGFQALEDSIVIYFITHNQYSPKHERCINYSYIKDWPIKEAILSDKDLQCPPIEKAEVFNNI